MLMVDLEMENGFLLHAPLKEKVTIHEFLAVADKVEMLARAHLGSPLMSPEQHIAEFHVPHPVHAAPAAAPAMTMSALPALPVAAPAPAVPVAGAASPDDFRLPHEDQVRLQHVANQVRSHMDNIKRHDDMIVRHEEHLTRILEYLQSLDKYIRR